MGSIYSYLPLLGYCYCIILWLDHVLPLLGYCYCIILHYDNNWHGLPIIEHSCHSLDCGACWLFVVWFAWLLLVCNNIRLISALSLGYKADFEAFTADCPPAQPIPMNQQIMMWLKASKGLRNGRIFSFGEFGVRLVRSGLIDDLTDKSFSSRLTQESVDPMKEDVKEMRDEMKALKEQNEELKEMMKAILEKVQGAGPSQ